MYLLYFSKHQPIVELQEDLRQQVEDHLVVSILFICALFCLLREVESCF